MSANTVESIIRKAVVDPAFRAALVSNPAETLAGYDLTTEEIARLAKVDASLFDGSPADLEERVSRGLSSIN